MYDFHSLAENFFNARPAKAFPGETVVPKEDFIVWPQDTGNDVSVSEPWVIAVDARVLKTQHRCSDLKVLNETAPHYQGFPGWLIHASLTNGPACGLGSDPVTKA